jgi:hypothetical protein
VYYVNNHPKKDLNMKPYEPTMQEAEEQHQKLVKWIKQNPDRAAFALSRLQSIFDDYIRDALNER